MFQYPLSGLDRLLLTRHRVSARGGLGFNTLCRVLIGCYTSRGPALFMRTSCFNTLCRVLIGCYYVNATAPDTYRMLRFNTLCRVLIGCYSRWDRQWGETRPSFNTLCRVLIGCYFDPGHSALRPGDVSIPSVGS